jgi:oxygen-dependent protoporphyrinogen oxidase
MVLGIYGGSIKMLSLKSCFPRFDEWEKKEKSIFRGLLKNRETTGMPKLYSFKHGMEELPRSLLKSIHAEIHYHTAVKSVKKNMLETSKGSTHADCIVFATSATIVGKLLGDSYPLASLPHQTITTINMGFSSIKLKKGFGYLVPSKEKCPILGMTWDSQIFPDQASYGARICLMIAGEVSPETIQTTVQQSLIEHMHIHEKPAVCNIHTARFAIPQYLIGHASLVSKLPAPPLFFAGSAYEGVGINDCLVRAEKVARHLSHFLALA